MNARQSIKWRREKKWGSQKNKDRQVFWDENTVILRTLSLTFVVEKTQRKQNGKFHDKHPNMLLMLTLTWCHHTPPDPPTSPSICAISAEHQLDNVACACYIGRERGADTLISDQNVAIRGGAAALLHQGCPVPVRDCQVVVGTGGTGGTFVLNVKCSELQWEDQSLLHLYRLRLLEVVRIVVGVVWWGDHTCGKDSLLKSVRY